jgi:signal transduction histidine kinase
MSSAGSQPAPQSSSEPALQFSPGAAAAGRSPLAHLLHALNQPLTGLQCSLELAVAGPRPNEYYVRALREGLELTGRIRILVEALREVADAQPSEAEQFEALLLDPLLRMTVADLLPVAAARGVRLLLVELPALPVRGDPRSLTTLLFRFLESALSLTREGSELRIVAAVERGHASLGHTNLDHTNLDHTNLGHASLDHTNLGRATLVVSWSPGPPPEHSPFSRSEVGLLIARAGWERAGAEWIHSRTESTETCAVRLPLAPAFAAR